MATDAARALDSDRDASFLACRRRFFRLRGQAAPRDDPHAIGPRADLRCERGAMSGGAVQEPSGSHLLRLAAERWELPGFARGLARCEGVAAAGSDLFGQGPG